MVVQKITALKFKKFLPIVDVREEKNVTATVGSAMELC